LQMLTESQNCSKQNKVILNVDNLISEIQLALINENYYDKNDKTRTY
jgi:hypothetical protein